MELNETKYIYVVLNDFNYCIVSCLRLYNFQSNAVRYRNYGTIPLIDAKPGVYYIAIRTNDIPESTSVSSMVTLEHKNVFGMYLNEIVVIVSNDWNYQVIM